MIKESYYYYYYYYYHAIRQDLGSNRPHRTSTATRPNAYNFTMTDPDESLT